RAGPQAARAALRPRAADAAARDGRRSRLGRLPAFTRVAGTAPGRPEPTCLSRGFAARFGHAAQTGPADWAPTGLGAERTLACRRQAGRAAWPIWRARVAAAVRRHARRRGENRLGRCEAAPSSADSREAA